MATVVVLYDYKDDAESVRAQHEIRPRHREFLLGLPGLLLTGPTDLGGAVIVFDGDPERIGYLMDEDPFAEADLIARRRVTTWDVVGGSLREALPG